MNVSREKMISYISILLIVCICTFLIAKFIVRGNIDREDVPIDTSTRM